MPRPEDRFTNTPEDAAAYERCRADNDYEDFDEGLDPPDSFETAEEEWILDGELDDRLNGVTHPPTCSRPPGHPPFYVRHFTGYTVIENCEPLQES